MAPPSSAVPPQPPKQTKKRYAASKKGDTSGAPVFLRKTYNMIDTCDRDIAAWSDNGTTFVVKDPDKFAATVIPEFFKHSNFSSFVRQLNFYGFRKIKSDPLRIKDAEKSEESKYWKFRHDKFQQGREDLLAEIKKSNHNESADKQDVESLKREIKNLKQSLAATQAEVEDLKNLFATGMIQNHQHISKKRKLDAAPSPVKSKPTAGSVLSGSTLDPVHVPSLPAVAEPDQLDFGSIKPVDPTGRNESIAGASFTSSDEAYLSELFAKDIDVKVVENNTPDVHISALPPINPVSGVHRTESTSTINTEDERAFAQIMAPDTDGRVIDVNTPDLPVSALPDSAVDGELMDKFRNALANLPTEVQKLFVDRIVATIGDPETFHKQAEAMTALAAAAAQEAQRKLAEAGHLPDDPKAVPMAAAVLEAYLSRFGGTGSVSGI